MVTLSSDKRSPNFYSEPKEIYSPPEPDSPEAVFTDDFYKDPDDPVTPAIWADYLSDQGLRSGDYLRLTAKLFTGDPNDPANTNLLKELYAVAPKVPDQEIKALPPTLRFNYHTVARFLNR